MHDGDGIWWSFNEMSFIAYEKSEKMNASYYSMTFDQIFPPKHSCESQLITTYHHFTRRLNPRDTKQVDGIVPHFVKAFD